MAKRHNWRAIKVHYSYEFKEAAMALNCSVSTIRNWAKHGLPIIDDRQPYLIDGRDLRNFLKAKNDNLKWRLPDTNAPWNYFPCFRCKDYRLPYLLMVDAHQRTPNAIDLSGICEACEASIRKTIPLTQLTKIERTLDVTFR